MTKIIGGGGATAHAERLKKGDIILRVNATDCVDVSHHVAVDALIHNGNIIIHIRHEAKHRILHVQSLNCYNLMKSCNVISSLLANIW